LFEEIPVKQIRVWMMHRQENLTRKILSNLHDQSKRDYDSFDGSKGIKKLILAGVWPDKICNNCISLSYTKRKLMDKLMNEKIKVCN